MSAAGGLLGLLAVLWAGNFWVAEHGNAGVLTIASMGASAVLLFAAPHGAMSQPWSVFGGHLVSALVGVTCARWFPIHAGRIAGGGLVDRGHVQPALPASPGRLLR